MQRFFCFRTFSPKFLQLFVCQPLKNLMSFFWSMLAIFSSKIAPKNSFWFLNFSTSTIFDELFQFLVLYTISISELLWFWLVSNNGFGWWELMGEHTVVLGVGQVPLGDLGMLDKQFLYVLCCLLVERNRRCFQDVESSFVSLKGTT